MVATLKPRLLYVCIILSTPENIVVLFMSLDGTNDICLMYLEIAMKKGSTLACNTSTHRVSFLLCQARIYCGTSNMTSSLACFSVFLDDFPFRRLVLIPKMSFAITMSWRLASESRIKLLSITRSSSISDMKPIISCNFCALLALPTTRAEYCLSCLSTDTMSLKLKTLVSFTLQQYIPELLHPN